MPLNACGWTTEEDEQLADLVQPHCYLYNVQDPSRKNILARETRWQEIAENLSKPGKNSFVKHMLHHVTAQESFVNKSNVAVLFAALLFTKFSTEML